MPPIAIVKQPVFVTVGTPAGLNAFKNGNGRTVTASRLNYVTTLLAGLIDPSSAVSAVETSMLSGGTPLFKGDKSNSVANPWAALDTALAQKGSVTFGFDCISLTTIAIAQLQQAGISAFGYYAYATTDMDATIQELLPPVNPTQKLDYYSSDGGTAYDFEGFLFLCAGGVATEAHTLWPLKGPYVDLAFDTTNPTDQCVGESPDAPKRLTLSVIFNTLLYLQQTATSSNGGLQWWVDGDDNPIGSAAVPFPIQGKGVK